ncbi:MAG: hypothetical protein HOC17_02640 [Candidatus Ruthia sp.]|nr:hypothetical protein [Candidatus Thioglobus sp.]MBT4668420.1 hypothetical protein [Candidatus Ruthturnera sp.]
MGFFGEPLFKNHKFDDVANSSLIKQLRILHATPVKFVLYWHQNEAKILENELSNCLDKVEILDNKIKKYGDKAIVKKVPYPISPNGTGDLTRIENFNNTPIVPLFDNPGWLAEKEARKNYSYVRKMTDPYGRDWMSIKEITSEKSLYLAKIRSQIDGNLYLIVGTTSLTESDYLIKVKISKTIDLVNMECFIRLSARAALTIEYYLIQKFRPTNDADKYFNPYSRFDGYDRILDLTQIDDIIYLISFSAKDRTVIQENTNEFLLKGWTDGNQSLQSKYTKDREDVLREIDIINRDIKLNADNLKNIKDGNNLWGDMEVFVKKHVSTMLKEIQKESRSSTYNEGDFADLRDRPYMYNRAFYITDVCYGLMHSKNGKFAIDVWMENNNLKHMSYWNLITNESHRLEFVSWIIDSDFFSNEKDDIDNVLFNCLKESGTEDLINDPSLLLKDVFTQVYKSTCKEWL